MFVLALSFFTLISPILGDECTSHVLSDGANAGKKGIGCVKDGCCQFKLQIGDLCPGNDVCCFTSDTCGGTSQTSGGSDQCTSHVISEGENAGKKGIGCVKNGCCQYGVQLADLCSGSDVCCFTSDTCSGSSGGGSDQCKAHVVSSGADAGKQGIGCVKSGCCQYGVQIADLCPGSDVCCFTSDSCSVTSGGCPHIISRAEWGARAPKHSIGNMAGPAQYVFIHHGAGVACHDKASCIREIKGYQDYHMNGHGWTDIGYNFVVGEDGNAYMARGWTEIGAHTYGYNSVGIAICVIGNFDGRVPNDAALNTIKQLISCGLAQGHISPSYTLKGHRDVGSTACPGAQLYNLIQSWPHYKSGTQRYG